MTPDDPTIRDGSQWGKHQKRPKRRFALAGLNMNVSTILDDRQYCYRSHLLQLTHFCHLNVDSHFGLSMFISWQGTPGWGTQKYLQGREDPLVGSFDASNSWPLTKWGLNQRIGFYNELGRSSSKLSCWFQDWWLPVDGAQNQTKTGHYINPT